MVAQQNSRQNMSLYRKNKKSNNKKEEYGKSRDEGIFFYFLALFILEVHQSAIYSEQCSKTDK